MNSSKLASIKKKKKKKKDEHFLNEAIPSANTFHTRKITMANFENDEHLANLSV